MREEKKGERRKMEIKKYVKRGREVVLVEFVLVPIDLMYLYTHYQQATLMLFTEEKRKKNVSVLVEYV